MTALVQRGLIVVSINVLIILIKHDSRVATAAQAMGGGHGCQDKMLLVGAHIATRPRNSLQPIH